MSLNKVPLDCHCSFGHCCQPVSNEDPSLRLPIALKDVSQIATTIDRICRDANVTQAQMEQVLIGLDAYGLLRRDGGTRRNSLANQYRVRTTTGSDAVYTHSQERVCCWWTTNNQNQTDRCVDRSAE